MYSLVIIFTFLSAILLFFGEDAVRFNILGGKLILNHSLRIILSFLSFTISCCLMIGLLGLLAGILCQIGILSLVSSLNLFFFFTPCIKTKKVYLYGLLLILFAVELSITLS